MCFDDWWGNLVEKNSILCWGFWGERGSGIFCWIFGGDFEKGEIKYILKLWSEIWSKKCPIEKH